ncbi:hypothetical protein E1176_01880 [Fulvivirga sp. RKSG066]|uniref:hypothetical protein n=1 Tax=Fulvivirga aurantia TaxID=2529383 RepID=UPI0012BC9D9B|nr:hypothetical protein [Fulvivirga aurantia]MTI19762.1 hypothetical protein [Fulvivirga aurantia]
MRLPNVTDILNKKEEEENAQPEPEETFGEDPFTFEDVKRYWDEFANQKKAEGKDSEYMVLNQNIDLEDGFIIKLPLTNSVKEVILDKFRSDLVQFLKTRLNNGKVKLVTHLLEAEETKMIYTNKEKFDHLAEKKPILNQLRDRLGLDPDF